MADMVLGTRNVKSMTKTKAHEIKPNSKGEVAGDILGKGMAKDLDDDASRFNFH